MPTQVDFAYTGAQQSVVVPAGVDQALLEVWGASGRGNGGEGAYVGATVHDLVAGETLYVFVGQQGSGYTGGWNGGGNGNGGTAGYHGYPGGGATDIRRGGTALADRIIVGGGGGGGGARTGSAGGTGGYPTGGTGGGSILGGTQTGAGVSGSFSQNTAPAIGTLGQGGHNFGGGTRKIGGGGGGLWGGNSGNGGSNYNIGGGGGSSYYDPELTLDSAEAAGTWVGDGQARITFADPVSFFETELVIATVTASGEVVIPRRSTPRRELLWVSDLAGTQVGVIG